MSSTEREIRISASDTGVMDKITRLKEAAANMGRGMLEDARRQSENSRELIKNLNDEIRAREQSLKIQEQAARMKAQERYDSASPDQKDKAKETLSQDLQRITIDSREEKLQTEILKQLLEATLKSSESEVRSDERGVRAKLKSDRDIEAMENSEEALKQMMQGRMVRDIDESAPDDPGPGKEGQKGMGALAMLPGFLNGNNPYIMAFQGASRIGYNSASRQLSQGAGRTAAALPFGLGVTAALAAMSIPAASDLYEGQGDISRATGMSKKQIAELIKDPAAGTDITQAQGLKTIATGIRSAGRDLTADEASSVIRGQRGLGLDPGSIARLGKNDVSGKTIDKHLEELVSITYDSNLHQSKMPDLLSLAVEMQEQQISVMGKANASENLGLINMLLKDSTGSGLSIEQTRATIQNLNSVVQGSGGAQVDAMMFAEFQKRNPNASISDFLLEKEKGTAGQLDNILVDRIRGDQESSDESKILTLTGLGFTVSQSKTLLRRGVNSLSASGKAKLGGNTVDASKAIDDMATSGNYGENEVQAASAGFIDAMAEAGGAAIDFANWIKGFVQGERDDRKTLIKKGQENYTKKKNGQTGSPQKK